MGFVDTCLCCRPSSLGGCKKLATSLLLCLPSLLALDKIITKTLTQSPINSELVDPHGLANLDDRGRIESFFDGSTLPFKTLGSLCFGHCDGIEIGVITKIVDGEGSSPIDKGLKPIAKGVDFLDEVAIGAVTRHHFFVVGVDNSKGVVVIEQLDGGVHGEDQKVK